MWSRAVWVEKGGREEEGVIPSCWIEGRCVRWPKVYNSTRHMQACTKPDSSWHFFKLIKTKATSDNKNSCDEADATTSVETDGEMCTRTLPLKRAHKKKVLEDFEEYAATGDAKSMGSEWNSLRNKKAQKRLFSEGNETDSLPTPPSKAARLPLSDSDYDENEVALESRQEKEIDGMVSVSECGENSVGPAHTTPLSVEPPTSKVRKGSSSVQSGRVAFPMSEAKFQKVVLAQLSDLRTAVERLGRRYEPETSEFHIVKVSTREEMEILEERLKDAQQKSLLVTRLARIGGITVRDNVSNVMHALFSDSMMSLMSLRGRKGKLSLESMEVASVITQSVLRNQSTTESAIRIAISSVLKFAPFRKDGTGARSKHVTV